MDRPPPDPRKLLDEWMEWERGEATPGRVMANLKTAGIRDLLEVLAAQAKALLAEGAAEPKVAAGQAGTGAPAEAEAGAGAGAEAVADAEWTAEPDSAPAWTPTV